ncbi:hypothetical protein DV736_g300, partial [Chaetothyriales sp. CBS 134916]
MAPRLALRGVRGPRASCTIATSAPSSLPTFLLPFLSILSSLSNVPSSYSKKIRRGRGPSSGKGKTSGRGQKGQKAKGKVPAHLTGGQTADEVTHGHFGFKNTHAVEMSAVNLDRIQAWIDAGRLDAAAPITLKELAASRAIHGVKDGGVKLLARGSTALRTKIDVVVSRASQAAIAAVEALGGSVTTRYYTPLAIRHIRAGRMHPYVSLKWDQSSAAIPASLHVDAAAAGAREQRIAGLGFGYRLPDPISRKELEYYRDEKTRGYLRSTVKPGYSPSLYHKTAQQKADEAEQDVKRRAAVAKQTAVAENRLW